MRMRRNISKFKCHFHRESCVYRYFLTNCEVLSGLSSAGLSEVTYNVLSFINITIKVLHAFGTIFFITYDNTNNCLVLPPKLY